jgi:hypothetical protein
MTYLAGSCPIVGSFGGRDRSPMGRSAAVRMEGSLTALGVDHDVKIYEGVGHGFMNDHDPADMTPLLVALAKVSGTPVRVRHAGRPPSHRCILRAAPHDGAVIAALATQRRRASGAPGRFHLRLPG